MRIGRMIGGLPVAALVAVGLGALPATAQVSASDGAAFVGQWTLEFEQMRRPDGAMPGRGGPGGGPGGAPGAEPRRSGGPMRMGGGGQTVEIAVAGTQLAAKVGGPMGREMEIAEISRDGDTLVLSYAMGMRDRSTPVVLRLTPDGTTMKAEMEVEGMGGQRMTRTGTATKQ